MDVSDDPIERRIISHYVCEDAAGTPCGFEADDNDKLMEHLLGNPAHRARVYRKLLDLPRRVEASSAAEPETP